ncbi:MAG TPA: hypothetical protein PLQ33_07830 [Peptococcaceae bacterium]|jgi:hypothetical protein|nr:hypothetical protein [Peptococcaceae bacterium]
MIELRPLPEHFRQAVANRRTAAAAGVWAALSGLRWPRELSSCAVSGPHGAGSRTAWSKLRVSRRFERRAGCTSFAAGYLKGSAEIAGKTG